MHELCLYHPTTTVIVDDNRVFLETLLENLSDARYRLFDSPKEALAFLDEYQKKIPKPEDFVGVTHDFVTNEASNVNVHRIYSHYSDCQRFSIPSVVIVDYDMPGISGIDFCRAILNYPIKKIMLTGVAGHKVAVEAFNEGIFDKFISKDEPDIFSVINQAIASLQKAYFSDLSNLAFKNITTITNSLLGSPEFQRFFSTFIQEKDIVEFYLIDTFGSFLLINKHEKPILFILQSEQRVIDYYQTAKENGAPDEIVLALANREKILCLLSEEDFNQPCEKWDYYLHNANPLNDIDGYYYAVLKDNELVDNFMVSFFSEGYS